MFVETETGDLPALTDVRTAELHNNELQLLCHNITCSLCSVQSVFPKRLKWIMKQTEPYNVGQ